MHQLNSQQAKGSVARRRSESQGPHRPAPRQTREMPHALAVLLPAALLLLSLPASTASNLSPAATGRERGLLAAAATGGAAGSPCLPTRVPTLLCGLGIARGQIFLHLNASALKGGHPPAGGLGVVVTAFLRARHVAGGLPGSNATEHTRIWGYVWVEAVGGVEVRERMQMYRAPGAYRYIYMPWRREWTCYGSCTPQTQGTCTTAVGTVLSVAASK